MHKGSLLFLYVLKISHIMIDVLLVMAVATVAVIENKRKRKWRRGEHGIPLCSLQEVAVS